MNYKSICNSFLFLIYSSYQLIRLSKVARCPDGVILASLAKPSRPFATHCLVRLRLSGMPMDRKNTFTLLRCNRSTWNNCWVRYSTIPDISWTVDDEHAINTYLAPVLGKKCPISALIVAQGMVKLAAVKHVQENGLDYSYWQAFLRDEFGVVCGNRNKLHAILKSALELELLDVHCAAIWHSDSRKGFATVYCPGRRVADRIIIPTSNATTPITP